MNNKRYAHITDQELLQRYYADRNKDWLGILLERYTLLLLGVCMKYLKQEDAARDAVQQIFLKAITELEKYKVDYIKSWLYMIARNHCLMQFRDKNRFPVEITEHIQLAAEEENLNHAREKDQLLEWMHEGLQDLNQEQQQCVTLFYLEKNTYQQIAARTGYSLPQVKSFIQNGKRNLKQLIQRRLQQMAKKS
ncbi:RNA polymerase sigma factor [Flavihumibacter petaseus]|uniref:Putative RNA polymerase ECF-type sigma factor n=1 Tax=Flavihumibacter petaseus NBRC 106054 TaxID=1220578 RepID=A0A0E9N1E1_9BACT|nr:sigma-70 family RNA polymerase sigma factor [Flavihumibacter petaseus]GAO43659.1 putative RNA polymerase ECF-type sigma factor [Flavihumibacter petaseus NBRC 106054]